MVQEALRVSAANHPTPKAPSLLGVRIQPPLHTLPGDPWKLLAPLYMAPPSGESLAWLAVLTSHEAPFSTSYPGLKTPHQVPNQNQNPIAHAQR